MNFEVNMDNLTAEEQAEIIMLVEKSKKKKAWKPKSGDTVFIVDGTGNVNDYTWSKGGIYFEQAYCFGNVFRTIEEARNERDKREIEVRLKRFAKEHNEPMVWSDCTSRKYCITYDYECSCVTTLSTCCYKQNNIYFSSNEIAEKAIEEIGEGNIKLWLGVYDEECED